MWLAVSLLAGCTTGAPSEPAAADPASGEERPPAETPVAEDEGQTDPIGAYMAQHFAVATFARDAIINGELDVAREPLMRLAEYDYAAVAPGGWLTWIAQLQQAARLTAEADSLDLAASGVATLARVCGECHAAMKAGPDFSTAPHGESGPSRDSMPSRMYRHMWAADRMWEGLTGPSEEAWHAGAEVLARAPEAPPVTEPPLPEAFVALLAEVRELGQRALEADTLAKRADLYAPFLASCAGCHAHATELEF